MARQRPIVDGQAPHTRLVAGREIGRDVGALRRHASRRSPPACDVSVGLGCSRTSRIRVHRIRVKVGVSSGHLVRWQGERVGPRRVGGDALEEGLRDRVALDDLRTGLSVRSPRASRTLATEPSAGGKPVPVNAGTLGGFGHEVTPWAARFGGPARVRPAWASTPASTSSRPAMVTHACTAQQATRARGELEARLVSDGRHTCAFARKRAWSRAKAVGRRAEARKRSRRACQHAEPQNRSGT